VVSLITLVKYSSSNSGQGDERPCLRCIKRGLQDHCHDGVRKKAKYLHDAPNEALVPGLGGSYHSQPGQATTNGQSGNTPSLAPSGQFFSHQVSPSDPFSQAALGGQTQSPAVDGMIDPFANQRPHMQSNNFPHNNQSVPQMQQSGGAVDQNVAQSQQQQYTAPFLDPTDPSFFNFDISSLNFGNQYGALEFGMLGHMASGAGETPDDSTLMGSMNTNPNIPFDSSASPQQYSTAGPNYSYGYPYQNSITVPSRHNSTSHGYPVNMQADANGNFPNAFAIGEGGSISSTSPGNTGLDFTAYGSSPVQNPHFLNQKGPQHDLARQAQQFRTTFSASDISQETTTRKRKRDPSHIYSSVKAPYSYTTGFHSLIAFIQARFPPPKTLRIAKAIASIRPSFIACTKELNRDDLIFMEKCFQRTLLQYDVFVSAYGSPTLICRRTGEIAAVSKEFSLLTGWRRDVLLGKEANHNINNGGASGAVTRGTATPSKNNATSTPSDPNRPQPIFLAELLDDDDVIDFYEDFAKMAFGDSRGYVVRPCKLLKYKTRDDAGWQRSESARSESDGPGKNDDSNNQQQQQRRDAQGQLFSGEAGMNALGERDGKVNCMFCWSIKRDVFDIPMMVVMNVSFACFLSVVSFRFAGSRSNQPVNSACVVCLFADEM